MFDVIVWVDASVRVSALDESLGIEYDPTTMWTVNNNEGLDALEKEVSRFTALFAC